MTSTTMSPPPAAVAPRLGPPFATYFSRGKTPRRCPRSRGSGPVIFAVSTKGCCHIGHLLSSLFLFGLKGNEKKTFPVRGNSCFPLFRRWRAFSLIGWNENPPPPEAPACTAPPPPQGSHLEDIHSPHAGGSPEHPASSMCPSLQLSQIGHVPLHTALSAFVALVFSMNITYSHCSIGYASLQLRVYLRVSEVVFPSWSVYSRRILQAGCLPTANPRCRAGHGWTTLPAPTTTLSPMVTPGTTTTLAPSQQFRPMRTGAVY